MPLRLLVLVVALAAGLGMVLVAPVHAAGESSVSGRVTGPNNAGVGSVVVRAHRVDGATVVEVADTTTATDGSWSISSLPSGTYSLEFDAPPAYVDAWLGGAHDVALATTFSLSDAQVLSGTNQALARAGAVAGTVVSEGTNVGIGSVAVIAQAATGDATYETTTDTDGTFSLGGLPAGTYTVRFDASSVGNWAPEFYGGAAVAAGASTVTIAAGSTKALGSIGLAAGATVSGAVTGPDGQAATGSVSLYRSGLPADDVWTTTTIGSDGTYSLDHLPAGRYAVHFEPDDDVLADEFYADKSTLSAAFGASPIDLAAGSSASGIDATLAGGGKISGKVVLPAGAGAGFDWDVYAVNVASGLTYTALADQQTGIYTITGLPVGAYRVVFGSSADGEASDATVQRQFYGGLAETSPITSAPVVTISSSGQLQTGIDASLSLGASVTGVVTSADGSSVTSCRITAIPVGDSAGLTSRYAEPDASGSFTIGGLSPHTGYQIQVGAPWSICGVGQKVRYVETSAASGTTSSAADSGGVVTPNAGAVLSLGRIALIDSLVARSRPSISGTLQSGETVAASSGAWTPAPSRFAYQWYADGSPISGATAPVLTLDDSLVGRSLAVSVVASKAGYMAGRVVSATSAAVQVGSPALSGPPARTAPLSFASVGATVRPAAGKQIVGRTLKAMTEGFPAGTTLKFQWYADGSPISKATKPTFKIPRRLQGRTFTYRVIASLTGFRSVTLFDRTISFPKTATPKTPKGAAKVGSTLHAAVSGYPAKTKLTYQWRRDGKVITGATKKVYKLTRRDRGARIRVTVTAAKTAFKTVGRTSSPTSVVR